jgi:hypothetical protein
VLSGSNNYKFKPSAAAIHPITKDFTCIVGKQSIWCRPRWQGLKQLRVDPILFKHQKELRLSPRATCLFQWSAEIGSATILILNTNHDYEKASAVFLFCLYVHGVISQEDSLQARIILIVTQEILKGEDTRLKCSRQTTKLDKRRLFFLWAITYTLRLPDEHIHFMISGGVFRYADSYANGLMPKYLCRQP